MCKLAPATVPAFFLFCHAWQKARVKCVRSVFQARGDTLRRACTMFALLLEAVHGNGFCVFVKSHGARMGVRVIVPAIDYSGNRMGSADRRLHVRLLGHL